MQKIKIALSLMLPEIPDERDACVKRIIEVLQLHKGIEKVHLVTAGADRAAALCFHFDPDMISIKQVEEIAIKEGASITSRYGHCIFEVEGIREMNQAAFLESELQSIPGVLDVSVSASGNISMEYDLQLTDKKNIETVMLQNHFHIVDKPANWATQASAAHKHKHDHNEHDHDHEGHDHNGDTNDSKWSRYAPLVISLSLLLSGIILDHIWQPTFFKGWPRVIWYAIAYIPVGFPVAKQGIRLMRKGDLFTEFMLMTIATLGAFCIGEYPEGVAVMVFYTIGELFQDAAVRNAKRSIKALLDIRPKLAFVQQGTAFVETAPENVTVGAVLLIKAGERVPLDGTMISKGSTFNTAALTGESKPSQVNTGESVLAGMINEGNVVHISVTKPFNDSSLARMLTLVQEATTRKAKTEQFIRKFSRIYTPLVVLLAFIIVLLPYFLDPNYVFKQWVYRALVFLVISCPCALVISIPLGYFGGIGAASKMGILFKGSNFLDLMTRVQTVIMDKTGTVTHGIFKVQKTVSLNNQEKEWLPIVAALEATSTHPVANAVTAYAKDKTVPATVTDIKELPGYGISGMWNDQKVWAGNGKLMRQVGITLDASIENQTDTIVIVALNQTIAGYLTIADELKEDSLHAIQELQKNQLEVIMLSGDKQAVVNKVAQQLGITKAFGDLLPEEKVRFVEDIKTDKHKVVAFVGDGINDAPVLALSDVGIAMGAMGSDVAIETADVIIQTDQPAHIAKAIRISRATRNIVWQNIIFAFGVKVIVLIMGAGGLATMWEAVFADVGVALLAILNAMRIQKKQF